VALQQVKSFLKVDDVNSDAEILSLIGTATDHAEKMCNRPFISRTFESTMDKFPDCIELNQNPVQSVDSVEYVDTDGATQTLAATEYKVDLGNKFRKARIVEAYGKSWPSIRREINSVTVTYTAGYGADWNAVPDTIKTVIMYLVNHYFINRGSEGEVPPMIAMLLENERVPAL
tara:strand:+ start:6418 stop:6939 length:522 start_codon:yes stop_codon:yes gene_type:complete